MNEREGVIKFDLRFTQKAFVNPPDLGKLIAWRTILHRLRLIGQDPERYGGLGFGNISLKIENIPDTREETAPFAISGTQTGAEEVLKPEHFSVVSAFSIENNRLCAEGPVKPSSEALTHAAIYGCNPLIRCVIHVHSPEIWRATSRLGISSVDKSIPYGTPEMANAVRDLVLSPANRVSGIFSMLGHEDG
ncbi:MAG: class II aldolase/adducin family protein, partial [Gammaproteobacteria bacterium]